MDGFIQVRPGLYQRINTPRYVPISPRFGAAIRGQGNSLLNEILDQALEQDASRRREATSAAPGGDGA